MSIAGLAQLLAIGLVGAIVALTVWTVWRLRHPPRRTSIGAALRGGPGDPGELSEARAFSEWRLEWQGRSLPVWEIPGDAPLGAIAVVTPGWGDSRVGALARLPALVGACSRVIAWDPPGLGQSGRGPWLMGLREHDALLALVERATVAGDRVVLMGWSAGAGTSIVGAAAPGALRERIAGVIAEAPYRQPWTPAFRVLRSVGMPWRINGPLAFAWMGWRLGVGASWKGFDRAEHAARLGCPLLVLHGDADTVSPIEDGRETSRRGRGRLAEIAGAGHNDLWSDARWSAQCAEEVRAFLARCAASHPIDGGNAEHSEPVLEDAARERA